MHEAFSACAGPPVTVLCAIALPALPLRAAARLPRAGRGRFRRRAISGSGRARRCRRSTLHYRTIGTPQRDASGVVRNAVLILHGTGGTGAGFLSRTFGGELFGAGPAARRHALLHHPAGRHRPRQVEQAERRPARALSEVHLRRHGPRAARDAGRRPEGESPAARARHVDGRDALLGLGRDVSGLRRRPRAAGQRADADRRAQPRHAQDDHGQHHAAIRRGRTATTREQPHAGARSAPSTC